MDQNRPDRIFDHPDSLIGPFTGSDDKLNSDETITGIIQPRGAVYRAFIMLMAG